MPRGNMHPLSLNLIMGGVHSHYKKLAFMEMAREWLGFNCLNQCCYLSNNYKKKNCFCMRLLVMCELNIQSACNSLFEFNLLCKKERSIIIMEKSTVTTEGRGHGKKSRGDMHPLSCVTNHLLPSCPIVYVCCTEMILFYNVIYPTSLRAIFCSRKL